MNFNFLKWGECHSHEFGFQNYISVWGLKNDVESIPFSRFSEQESNVSQTSGHLKFMKTTLTAFNFYFLFIAEKT